LKDLVAQAEEQQKKLAELELLKLKQKEEMERDF